MCAETKQPSYTILSVFFRLDCSGEIPVSFGPHWYCCVQHRGGLLKTHPETILSLGREAIRFLLCDLRTHCLNGLASRLSPRESIFHMTVLHQHALWVDKAEHCQSLEQYLTIFASCIKHMKLPSHLCQAEQRRLLTSIASLAIPPCTH